MAEKLIASCTNKGTMSLHPQPPIPRPLRRLHEKRSSSSSSAFSCSNSSRSSSTGQLLRAPAVLLTSRTTTPRLRSRQGARVVCLFGGEKRDAARKALESALGEKKEVFSKWDEEIKKREASGSGGGGKGRGRGWGSGGGGGGGGNKDGGDDASAEGSESGFQFGESLQVVYAFAGLAGVYLMLTQGSRILALVLNSLLWVSRGFKPRPKPRYAPAQQSGSAEDHVRSKWASDDQELSKRASDDQELSKRASDDEQLSKRASDDQELSKQTSYDWEVESEHAIIRRQAREVSVCL